MSSVYEALQRARQAGQGGIRLRSPQPRAPSGEPARSTAIAHSLAPLLAAIRPLIDAASGTVLQVVAATAGEGASTISREFALLAATAGNFRTALVDADRASLATAHAFNCDTRHGLIDALRESGGEDGVLHPVAGAALAVGCLVGEVGPGPADATTVREIYRRLREQYQLTIVDCPAVTGGEYPALAPEACDGVILVVRAETTRPAVVAHAKTQIQQSGGNLLGAVLNRRHNYIPEFLYRML